MASWAISGSTEHEPKWSRHYRETLLTDQIKFNYVLQKAGQSHRAQLFQLTEPTGTSCQRKCLNLDWTFDGVQVTPMSCCVNSRRLSIQANLYLHNDFDLETSDWPTSWVGV